MKANEFREMSVADLNKKIATLKEELFNLRFQHATNQLENANKLVSVRRDIARAKTILHEKEAKEQA